MVHYMDADLLVEMCGPESATPNFASSLTEVLSIVLDAEVGSLRFYCLLLCRIEFNLAYLHSLLLL